MSESENFEKIHIPFDIKKLQEEFSLVYQSYEPVMPGPSFGGWSVTSSDGDYRDGWVSQKKYFDAKESSLEDVRERNQQLGFKGPQFYRTPTQICTGQIQSIVDFLDREGYFPCRARYTVLKANSSIPFHRDYPEWLYGVRLHIPIITNAHCFFEYEGEKKHLPSDGSAFLMKINKMHRVYNDSNDNRIHFICDFFDTQQKTKFNKFTEEDFKKVGLKK